VRALLLANRDDADPGFVGESLRSHGYAFSECHRENASDWPVLAGIELVVSLGSDWSVYWDHVRDSVEAEAALLRAAHSQQLPILGICFGGQILCHALGGSVAPAPVPEVGWHDVTSAIPELAGDGPWFQWHSDRFTAPPSAEALALSVHAEQAFRLGRTLALQFHPEVNESIVARWSSGGVDELAGLGIERGDLVEQTRANVERSRLAASGLVDWFVTQVAGC
jgi:GMP synthase-like glutamine amidotransferase